LLIGGATILWTFVMGATGWYKDPALVNVFFLVVLFEIALLWWGLRQTAATNGYGGQVAAGTTMAAIGAVLVFGGSLLFTTVFFPNYFAELRAVQEQLLRQQGLGAADIQSQIMAQQRFQTPVWNAVLGVIGTIVTGAVVSAVLAVFVRRR
jgi:hypothetical protein